jgi:hypothetical protein
VRTLDTVEMGNEPRHKTMQGIWKFPPMRGLRRTNHHALRGNVANAGGCDSRSIPETDCTLRLLVDGCRVYSTPNVSSDRPVALAFFPRGYNDLMCFASV